MYGLGINDLIKVVYRGDEKILYSYNDLKPFLELLCESVSIINKEESNEIDGNLNPIIQKN